MAALMVLTATPALAQTFRPGIIEVGGAEFSGSGGVIIEDSGGFITLDGSDDLGSLFEDDESIQYVITGDPNSFDEVEFN